MDAVGVLSELIVNVGFPVAAYLISIWQINKKDEAAREDMKEYNKTINTMIEKNAELSDGLHNITEAVNNNTAVLTSLVMKIEDSGE